MTPIERARIIRAKLDTITTEMTDEKAIENAVLFVPWDGDGKSYKTGDRFLYEDELYTVLQNHTSQPDWTPDTAHSLYAKVLIPDPDVTPEWVQPDSTNPYKKGDKVMHNGIKWESEIDGNVWEPGVYGWKEVVSNAEER